MCTILVLFYSVVAIYTDIVRTSFVGRAICIDSVSDFSRITLRTADSIVH